MITKLWTVIALVWAVIAIVWAIDDPHLRFYLGDLHRNRSNYVFTAPEVLHPGKVATIGVFVSNLKTDVLIHVYLVTWHGEKVLASAEKYVSISDSGRKPYLLKLWVPSMVKNEYALLVISMLQHPYREERKVVRIMKEKPDIMLSTDKAYYQLGENVELWVFALDHHRMPYEGQASFY
ncbi:uncharacterized protein LOC135687270 isoform X1 [Rhopilema esculentum]|uniref:uncharacterized protein LOC135687270 isoform X1 n=1 Tax=Rhopilema esculentum TaxID=499914 RepID=UPI0031E2A5B3